MFTKLFKPVVLTLFLRLCREVAGMLPNPSSSPSLTETNGFIHVEPAKAQENPVEEESCVKQAVLGK